MIHRIALAALASTLMLAPAAHAADTRPAAAAEARIPFANHGGIWNWYAENRDTLYIQGQDRKWYRADLMTPCIDLGFADRIGFVTNPDGSFDHFSEVLVRGQRCPVKSLTRSGPPPRWGTHDKPAKR